MLNNDGFSPALRLLRERIGPICFLRVSVLHLEGANSQQLTAASQQPTANS